MPSRRSKQAEACWEIFPCLCMRGNSCCDVVIELAKEALADSRCSRILEDPGGPTDSAHNELLSVGSCDGGTARLTLTASFLKKFLLSKHFLQR